MSSAEHNSEQEDRKEGDNVSRLVWNARGERFYETGVDRGVLYVDGVGVPWNGLVSVSETPSGGEPKPYYIDGFKYLNLSSAEEYEASLTAFSSPPEFAPCDGVSSVHNGLFATQQPRKSFDLSYRTKIGNDIDGQDHGYKIHLVYNALAAPTSKNNATQSENVEPIEMSWDISTVAPNLSGRKPTAHFIIDSRYTHEGLLFAVENILYGDETDASRLPSAQELVDIFANFIDGGAPGETVTHGYDGGIIPAEQLVTIDGGTL
jgi:hypothetical protein